MANLKIKETPWEQRNLGLHACEIIIDNEECISEDEISTISNLYEYIVVKMSTYSYKLSAMLQRQSFIFNETILSLSKMMKDFNEHNPVIKLFSKQTTVEHIIEAEEIALIAKKLGNDMFLTDRIALNPNFGPNIANIRYGYWIKEMTTEGCELYELKYHGCKVGFCLIKCFDSTIDYLLGGLYPQYQDKGIGILTSLF